MDLNKDGVLLSYDGTVKDNDVFGDITLSLNCLGHGGSNTARYGCNQSNLGAKFSNGSDDGCRLVLGLGPTPSACSDNYYNAGFKKKKGLFTQGLLSEGDSILQLSLSGGANESSSGLDVSISTEMDINTFSLPSQVSAGDNLEIPVVDEGSTSAKKSGGYMPSLILAPRTDSAPKVLIPTRELLELQIKSQSSQEPSTTTEYSIEYSVGTISEQATTGASSDHRTGNSKKCRFFGCAKGARGASGLCIGHGGGQRCQKPGCNKGSESRTAYCKAHGGGKRCQHLGCTKSAEGKTDYCIAHGGGRRCGFPGGCNKAARGKSGLCIRHGGGKRCKMENCSRSAEGQAGLCISHGGGRRCKYHECKKGAQGSTMFCKAHGGGKRCIFAGCTKGAEGSTPLCKGHGGGKRCLFDGGGICPKSVHGGTNFCVAHGGGKRCAVPGCTKSARGRTDCCVKHGGGKRCKFEECGKSAQGSTDFCKAHGGGKRCTWGEGKCEKFARGKSGLCAAHSSMVLERETNKGGLIASGLFQGVVTGASMAGSSSRFGRFGNSSSLSGVSVAPTSIELLQRPAKIAHLIPPQVLVPLSMKSTSSNSSVLSAEKAVGGMNANVIGVSSGAGSKSLDFMVPEGRVHGGGLMSLFGGNLKNAFDRI
ncbi:uncharacterized protein LOC122309391 [Carya illinoinensis]|uniref:WRKY19-like zinc finger domain-containing protein n=1 Tax=Carya illinoinensis TaxID=32201 RepID=A0A8T1QEW7_CARIL|nr:uncharacterized protein LOC122309391 [Carya illinoinensis]XP_042978801.1 uncharacterized protein LOC122309391 [Carya illinoinensis]XP_042978803.1 uncharacterized protein LOC122309391 [Carya illinoinensis]KAG6652919.1 hypothetical protein CIPAW_05G038900 [Carya illinoinensis]KAG6711166.1 hypothetical protein I3842_05G039600 [Carya illinoinensis]KAG6711167.1 hypothetical protein I3842_05G039600 [Carya illinoinensis]KAG6711168.1 hypothetical protein I3842_05G039600 [Carya illinoinensis]KAG67